MYCNFLAMSQATYKQKIYQSFKAITQISNDIIRQQLIICKHLLIFEWRFSKHSKGSNEDRRNVFSYYYSKHSVQS